ncbi:hypothetical protein CSUI_001653 [Cystoisospora suis]|uniref:Uncharacterized protein n=1 Tax=Cystoisospora suis TaxID=483139 RepID=A0A2C6KK96_9APIC|nr:hypothetical protein CSUI_001653 [Cystoisospora suis]
MQSLTSRGSLLAGRVGANGSVMQGAASLLRGSFSELEKGTDQNMSRRSSASKRGKGESRNSSVATRQRSLDEPEEYSIYCGAADGISQPLQSIEIFGEASRRAAEIRAQAAGYRQTQEGLRSILVPPGTQVGGWRNSGRSNPNRVRFTETNELREYSPSDDFRSHKERALEAQPRLATLRGFLFRYQTDRQQVQALTDVVSASAANTTVLNTHIAKCVTVMDEEEAKKNRPRAKKESPEEAQRRIEEAFEYHQNQAHRRQQKVAGGVCPGVSRSDAGTALQRNMWLYLHPSGNGQTND